MNPAEIRALVQRLDTTSSREEEEAWRPLSPLGSAVVPFLAEAYPGFRCWQGRASLVYHSVRYARSHESAFHLGLAAMNDRAKVVRYRALSLLAYSLREDALPALTQLLGHPVRETAEDVAAAIDAIQSRNHHYFHDRTHSGRMTWNVTLPEG